MKAFSELIHRLYFTTSNSAKASIFKAICSLVLTLTEDGQLPRLVAPWT